VGLVSSRGCINRMLVPSRRDEALSMAYCCRGGLFSIPTCPPTLSGRSTCAHRVQVTRLTQIITRRPSSHVSQIARSQHDRSDGVLSSLRLLYARIAPAAALGRFRGHVNTRRKTNYVIVAMAVLRATQLAGARPIFLTSNDDWQPQLCQTSYAALDTPRSLPAHHQKRRGS
jgi:hypothetical protein